MIGCLKFFEDKKAQISAEMIIVLAALLGIAVIVIRQVTSSVDKTAKTMDTKTDNLNNELDNIDSN